MSSIHPILDGALMVTKTMIEEDNLEWTRLDSVLQDCATLLEYLGELTASNAKNDGTRSRPVSKSSRENEITTLKQHKDTADQKIQELERQIVDIRDGYQHKLDALRGRIRGVLQGELTRWIETALDAARSDPPFTKAIDERLEDALKLIAKEIQWLQPSA